MHLNLGDIYAQVRGLPAALNNDVAKAAAAEIIRGQIDRVVLTPRAGGAGLDAALHGSLAAILAFCNYDAGKSKSPGRWRDRESIVGGCGPDQSPYTCVLPEHKPVSHEAPIDQWFKCMRRPVWP